MLFGMIMVSHKQIFGATNSSWEGPDDQVPLITGASANFSRETADSETEPLKASSSSTLYSERISCGQAKAGIEQFGPSIENGWEQLPKDYWVQFDSRISELR